MVGASKILTVSYGTFSCTLEGFEEPFSTMKAIAEYFRDLAADDRYFGAEPPTPDAEMLHRIAEREIQRRVEAKISEHGVVLRADAAPAAEPAVTAPTVLMPAATPAAAEAAPAAMPTVETASEAAEADTGAEVFTEYFEDEEGVAAPGTGRDESEGDSVAAKLLRIRAVVAAAQAAPAVAVDDEEAAADFAPTASVPAGDFGFELDLDDISARLADETVAEEVEETAPVVEAEAEADDAFDDEIEESFEDEATEAVTGAPEMIAETGAAEEADVEPVAVATGDEDVTLLASIETHFEEAAEEVVAEEEVAEEDTGIEAEIEAVAEEPQAGEPVEDEVVETSALDLGAWRMDAAGDEAAASSGAEEEDLDLAAELEPELEAEDDFDEDYDAAELEDDFEDEAELEGAFEDETEIEAEAAGDAETDDLVAEEDDAPEAATGKTGFFAQAAARVIKIRKTRAAVQDDEPEDEVEDAAAIADQPEHDATEDRNAAIFAALNDEIDEDEEFDAEIDEADADETAGEPDAALLAGIGAAIGETGLDPDAEDDLLRELADVAREARRDSHEGRAILEGNADDDDASVERLMEEAKSKLEGDESRRRFSAISHLKAAVVATVADRKMKLRDAPVSGEAEAEEEIERYRDDLSKAVRPRRPAADSAPTTRRPTIETRQAPLVLVSEQRIDAPTTPRNDNAVVRPRRISAGNLVRNEEAVQDDTPDTALSPDEAKSFAEFAERLGAVNLSDMLEAAAAYTATVEGLPHFSRPQILSKVARVAEDEEYSREDGLRSFGMLLRQGKIQKISRGQFMITEASKFMSEARRAAR